MVDSELRRGGVRAVRMALRLDPICMNAWTFAVARGTGTASKFMSDYGTEVRHDFFYATLQTNTRSKTRDEASETMTYMGEWIGVTWPSCRVATWTILPRDGVRLAVLISNRTNTIHNFREPAHEDLLDSRPLPDRMQP